MYLQDSVSCCYVSLMSEASIKVSLTPRIHMQLSTENLLKLGLMAFACCWPAIAGRGEESETRVSLWPSFPSPVPVGEFWEGGCS